MVQSTSSALPDDRLYASWDSYHCNVDRSPRLCWLRKANAVVVLGSSPVVNEAKLAIH